MMLISSPPCGPCSVGPDFGFGAGLADEGIVAWHRAVRFDAHDLADVIGQILRVVARLEMIAERHEQIAVGALRDAAGDIVAAGRRPDLAEDDDDAVKPRRIAGVELGARHRDVVAVIGVEAEIDRAVLREGAIQRDIEQSGLAAAGDLGHAGQRRRQLAVARDDAHAAGPFGHQHAPVGQESQRPGMHKTAGDGFNRDRACRAWKRWIGG
jgi:hypothetical protein